MAHMTRVLRGAEFIQTTSHIKDVWGGIEANSQHSRDTLLQVELKHVTPKMMLCSGVIMNLK